MMKRLGLFLFAVLFIAALSSGCDNFKGEDGKTVTSGQFEKSGTLQGFVFDAITGARLGGNDLLKMRLYQGSERRDPSVLVTDTTNVDYGFYAYNDVPLNLYAGNITYQLVVTRTGYQDFKGNVAPTAIVTAAAASTVTNAGEWSNYIDDQVRVDGKYNFLGNVYLFPNGATAGNITVKVVDSFNRAVPSATVRLQQNIAGSVPTAEIGNRLPAVAGLMPNLSATTDSTGIATFTAENLVLGGQYTPSVDPITFQNQQLGSAAGAAFVVGVNRVDRTIALANLEANLYIASASNSAAGSVTASGVLTLTFNQAVTFNFDVLSDTTQFTAGIYDTTIPAVTVTKVTAALDATGKILTLTPTFSATPTTWAPGATVRYTHVGNLYVSSTQALIGSLGGGAGTFASVADKAGNAVSSDVLIKAR